MTSENTLWMGDIEPWMTESIIINSFQFFNITPTNVKLIKDKNKGINRTYCFVSFKSIQDATNALNNLNGKVSPTTNAIFKLNWAGYHSAFSKVIYVGNLNLKVDDNDLYELFNKNYKSVHHATVISDKGISKGYGFVSFKDEEEYLRSLKEMNGYNFYGNNIKVKEQRKKDNENSNNNNDLKENKNKNKKKNKNSAIAKNNNILLNNLSKQEANIPFAFPKPNNLNNNINNNPNQIINCNNTTTPNNNFINNNNLNKINLGNITNNQKGNNIINFNSIQNINIINNNDNRINNNNYIFNKDINNYNQSKPMELLLNGINTSIPYMNKNTYPSINETNKDLLINNNVSYKKDKILYHIDNKNIQNNIINYQNYAVNKKNIINYNNNNYSKINEKTNEINNLVNNQGKIITNNINFNKNKNEDNFNFEGNEKNKNKVKNKSKNKSKNEYKLEILDNIDETTLYKKIHESILRTFEYQKKMLNSNNTVKFKSKKYFYNNIIIFYSV